MFKENNKILWVCCVRVKIITEYFRYGIDYVNNGALIYYKVIGFFPNAMTWPYFKSHRIKYGTKEGSIELKKELFNIDKNDIILVKYTNGDDYTFRLYWYVFFIYIE